MTLIAVTLLPALSGCADFAPRRWPAPPLASAFSSPGADLTIRSLSRDNIILRGGFEHGIYTIADKNTAIILLYDGPVENPSQAVTIRMFWNPHAGRTPIDPTATNATMQYVIFTGEGDKEVGIYSGAGYIFPRMDMGGRKFIASVWQATLRMRDDKQTVKSQDGKAVEVHIRDHSPGFHDQLGQAQLAGKFTVERDDLGIQQAMHRLNVLVRERLGRTRLVEGDSHGAPQVFGPLAAAQ